MTAGLVLAAGAGTRFGIDSKLLAEVDGRPLLEHAVAAQSASLSCGVSALRGVDKVIVTLGDMPRIGPDLIARFIG